MNLLFMTSSFWPKGSGGQRATYLYLRHLVQNNVDIRILSATSEHDEPKLETIDERAEILRMPVPNFLGKTKYSLIVKLPSLFFKSRIKEWMDWADVIYMTAWFPALPLLKRYTGNPVVAHIHSYFPFCPIGSFHNLYESTPCRSRSIINCFKCAKRHESSKEEPSSKSVMSGLLNCTVGRKYPKFLREADAILFVSKAQKKLVLEKYPQIATKSAVIHNLMPNYEYIPIEGKDFGYFGGKSPLKGFKTLVRGWIKSHISPNIKIQATKINSSARGCLEKIGINPHGYLTEENFKKLYKKIRAVIVPSIYREPLPYTVAESLMRGRIVIASKVGGISEITGDIEGAFLINPSQPSELSRNIEKVSSMSEEKVKNLGEKSREKILEKFDNLRTVKKFIKILEKVRSSSKDKFIRN